MADILVVNEDALARERLAAELRDAGYRTCTAATVPEAMQILRHGGPDLLITEVRVNGYNGLHLVAMAPRPLPAIVMTATPDTVVENDARRLGAEYLCTPVPTVLLQQVITELLRTAEERGVFLPARTETRLTLAAPVSVGLGDSPARILDVSAGGARLEVQRSDDGSLPPSLTLEVEGTTIPVDIAWQRRQEGRVVLCGVSVEPETRPAWAAVIARYMVLTPVHSG